MRPTWARRGVRNGGVRQIHEDALAVAQRRDTYERPDRLDVAAGLADEAANVSVGELDLDRNGAPTALECLDFDLLRLLRQRLRHILDEGAVVDAGSGRSHRAISTEAAALRAAPKVRPSRSVSLRVAQGSPPASTSSAPLRSAERL